MLILQLFYLLTTVLFPWFFKQSLMALTLKYLHTAFSTVFRPRISQFHVRSPWVPLALPNFDWISSEFSALSFPEIFKVFLSVFLHSGFYSIVSRYRLTIIARWSPGRPKDGAPFGRNAKKKKQKIKTRHSLNCEKSYEEMQNSNGI